MSEAPSTPFELLLLRQRSRQQRERLRQLCEQHDLTHDDALWGLLAVIETYCDDLHHRASALPPAAPAAAITWLGLSLGAAAQVVLLALAFAVGQSTALTARAPWWSIPAGWLAFALATPALMIVAWAGWRTRQTDPWLGWGLLALSSIASVASLGALLVAAT